MRSDVQPTPWGDLDEPRDGIGPMVLVLPLHKLSDPLHHRFCDRVNRAVPGTRYCADRVPRRKRDLLWLRKRVELLHNYDRWIGHSALASNHAEGRSTKAK